MTKPLIPAMFLLLLVALAQDLRGQKSSRSVVMPYTQSFDFTAKANGQRYRLFVSLPDSYSANDTTRYRVLYLLDGNPFFPMVSSLQKFFVGGEEVPELIIVGIGYPVDGLMKTMGSRTLDYTPTKDTAFDNMLTKELKMPIVSGGADRFLAALRTEIIPFVEKRFKTSGDRALAGHSFGALFGAHVLFNDPSLFNRYLLSSISFPWDKQQMIAEEQAFYQRGNKAIQAKVFVSVGEKEMDGMLTPMKQLVQIMRDRNYNGLEIEEKIFPDETHATVVAASFDHGLRYLYGGMVKRKW